MKCPKCNSINIEKKVLNQQPVLNYTCSGMHSRINKTVIHSEYLCKDCQYKWKWELLTSFFKQKYYLKQIKL